MPDPLYVFYFFNPYTGEELQVFATDYTNAIVELGKLTEYSSAFVYKGMSEITLQNLSD
jgi:hypothetical protein